jgi:GTP-binding protein Era
VALLGWTNVGKSALLNRLVGDKLAAVADAAQTTRSRIVGVLHVPGRAQVAFADTPGLHRPQHAMNRAMIRGVHRTLSGVDLGALVIDAARGYGAGDRQAAALVRGSGLAALVVLNKIDLVRPKSLLLPLIAAVDRDWPGTEVLPVSARTGEGCAGLTERLIERLPGGSPLYPEDYLTDQTERALAAEWIREKLLHLTRQELPHVTAVLVERWVVREDGLLEIEATILVERESQKQIVIGRGGRLLKEAGTAARQELERFLGRRVHLRLWARSRPGWRDDERTLRELGLE